ncbi:ECHD3-like protein [Mya arenaria]|uniref:Enoyl-CoA hydratase domain-containing protein 3, mitochondrial n=1 Tax=Mya arenaria TaxID=6604 RepID=A0ABY7FDK2_MYAAR|nr:ECHD3-like protein [Mya arenaria]
MTSILSRTSLIECIIPRNVATTTERLTDRRPCSPRHNSVTRRANQQRGKGIPYKSLATAAGCQMVASCDIAVVTEKSKFATPGVNVGLFCSTPAVAVGRSVPRKVAMEMLFTGLPITAQEALLHGLVSRVVSEENLTEGVMVDNLAYQDGQEGIKAFVEKRHPTWSHSDDKTH